jgi:hypothetical protein
LDSSDLISNEDVAAGDDSSSAEEGDDEDDEDDHEVFVKALAIMVTIAIYICTQMSQ